MGNDPEDEIENGTRALITTPNDEIENTMRALVTTPLTTDSDKQCNNESKGEEAPETLMQLTKPTIHHRGRHSYHKISGKGDDAEEELFNQTLKEFQASKWHIVSAAIFTSSSILYV